MKTTRKYIFGVLILVLLVLGGLSLKPTFTSIDTGLPAQTGGPAAAGSSLSGQLVLPEEWEGANQVDPGLQINLRIGPYEVENASLHFEVWDAEDNLVYSASALAGELAEALDGGLALSVPGGTLASDEPYKWRVKSCFGLDNCSEFSKFERFVTVAAEEFVFTAEKPTLIAVDLEGKSWGWAITRFGEEWHLLGDRGVSSLVSGIERVQAEQSLGDLNRLCSDGAMLISTTSSGEMWLNCLTDQGGWQEIMKDGEITLLGTNLNAKFNNLGEN